ncbi:MAG: ATP-binding protein [Nitrososphaerota archaeon]|nr:ATP-binding protein [Nitrososphaerota archaeon]
MGRLPDTREPVALDLDNPKVIGVFGFMGSGKSYLLGDIIETAVVPIDRLNALASPLAVVVFNYRRAASDRFELASLAQPNCNNAEVERLLQEYSTVPRGLPDVRVFCLPGQLAARRAGEYAGIVSEELFFRPDLLEVEDWELLMGQPGSEAVFAQVIRHSLRELRAAGPISIDALQRTVVGRLTGSSRNAAQLRFELVRQFVSQTRGIDFSQVVAPGRVTIVDLRDPLFNKEDALRFFLVCANSISRIQGLNKMVIFDEAHEYMSDLFADLLNSRIRLIRHEGVTYVFATQDVGSIPLEVRRFLTTRFVFDLGTAENVTDLTRVYPEFEGIQLRSFPAGQCLLQDKDSVTDIFQQPRMIRVRPRVSQHGGASRIFSTSTPVPSTGRVADGPPRDTQNSDPSG